jgi:putative membrane protein
MIQDPANRSPIDRQREHQANERTFLAWLRTSIALIGFGFAIARFGMFLRQITFVMTEEFAAVDPVFNSQVLGAGLVVFGIIVIAIAAWRYNQVFWQIERGDYRPNRWVIWVMTIVVIILGLLSLPLLILGQQELRDTSPEQSHQSEGSARDLRRRPPSWIIYPTLYRVYRYPLKR